MNSILTIKTLPNDWERFSYLLNASDLKKLENQFLSPQKKSIICASAILKKYYIPFILGLAPHQIKIEKNINGKPHIVYTNTDSSSTLQPCKLYFNISHSENYISIITSDSYNVGIDLQKLKNTPLINNPRILFSKTEKDLILQSSPKNKLTHFFRLWVKKESYLKALGIGITGAINSNLNVHNKDVSDTHIIYVSDISDKLLKEKNCFYLAVCILLSAN